MPASHGTKPEDVSSIDWSYFEPGSVRIYYGGPSQWIAGRAMWCPKALCPTPTTSRSVGSSASSHSESPLSTAEDFMEVGKSKENPQKSPDSSSPTPNAKLARSPSPSINVQPIKVGFLVAMAKDPESKARLRAENEIREVMQRAGLPVVPTIANWTDRFGNFACVLHKPLDTLLTLREMYILPFTPNPEGAPRMHRQSEGIVSVLGEFLEHAIQMVSTLQTIHKGGFVLRCCRTDSWVFAPKCHLHPNGFGFLCNATGAIQLEPTVLGETSNPQTLDRKETEKWMVYNYVQYLAPEILGRLDVPVDARADIFSVGICLYETLVGHPPMDSSDLLSTIHQILAVEPRPVHDVNPDIPQELSQIISKCLAKAPHDRYSNAHSLRHDLEELARAWEGRGSSSAQLPIDVGAMDRFSRFRLTDELVGVDDSLAVMRAALNDAQRGDVSVVSIGGSSGTGKTALALSIRNDVDAIGGRLCWGKYDSTSYNRPLAPIWQIINQLAQPLLALSEGELENWRLRIRHTVGPTLVHLFESCLDPDLRAYLRLGNSPELPLSGSSLPPSYSDAFHGAIIRFLAMFVKAFADDPAITSSCTHRPLVFFFDDVQWSSADDIVFFTTLLSGDSLSSCLLVFAFRDNEGTEAFLTSEFRKRLCKASKSSNILSEGDGWGGEIPYVMHTKLLKKEDIYLVMKDMLKQPGEREDPSLWNLATLLHAQSMGNAQRFKLLVGSLYQNKMLWFDWDTCTWNWDIDLIANQSTADSALQYWESLLTSQATSEVRRIIFAAAAISTGGAFSLKLLAHATQQPLKTILKLVRTLAEDARVFASVEASRPSLTGISRSPNPIMAHYSSSEEDLLPRLRRPLEAPSDLWTFTHDQLQLAANVLLPDSQRAAAHHQIGVLISELQEHSLDERLLQPLVHNLNESRRLGFCGSQEDNLKLIKLNIRVARANLRSAAGPAALKHLEQARNLLGDDGKALWRLDYDTAYGLSAAFMEYYTFTGQFQKAVDLAEEVLSECTSVLDKLTVSYWRIKALVNVDAKAAIDFGLCQLADLCHLTFGDSPEVLEALQSKASFGQDATVEGILAAIPPRAQRKDEAEAAILTTLLPPVVIYRSDLAEELSLRAFLAVRKGFTEHSAFAYSIRVILKHQQGLHAEANLMSAVCAALTSRIESPYLRIEVRLAQAGVAYYTSHTLRDIAAEEMSIASDAMQLANWDYSNWTLGCLYYVQLMGGSETLPFVKKSWMSTLRGRVAPTALNFVLIGEITSAILNGSIPLPDHGPLIDLPVPLGPNNSFHEVHKTSCETILSLIFERPDPGFIDTLLGFGKMVTGTFWEAYFPFLLAWLIYSLDASGVLQNEAVHLAHAEQAVQTLKGLAESTEMSHNFILPYKLVKARMLERNNQYSEALAILETAINDVVMDGTTLLLCVAYEQAGKLVKKWTGNQRLSRTYLNHAYQAYENFGAQAKCAEMMKSDQSLGITLDYTPPLHVNLASPSSPPPSDASVAVSDSVDLATILSVVSTWQREKSASRVAASLVNILIKTMGARYGALALMSKGGELRLSVAGTLIDLRSELDVSIEQCGELAPPSLFNYALRTKKTIVDISGISAHVGLRNDPFLAKHKPHSVFVYPIFEEDSLRGICYMDSARYEAFSKASFEIIGLLSTGAAVAIQRAHLLNELDAQTKTLEHTVRIRTAAAEAAAAKAEQASLAQARFLQTMSHEMRTPLNSVVVLSDLLLEAPLDPVLYEYVLTIKASSNDLLSVIRDILDFSRLESKSVALEELPFDITSLIDDTLDQFAEVAANKNIELLFDTSIGSDVPVLRGDVTRVKQCLSNFLSNALKFTDDNGTISVTVTFNTCSSPTHTNHPRMKTLIAVADTGIGIQAAKQPLLFKKFSQVDNSTTRLFGGSGLGLAIVRELSQLMCGDAWCESEYGKGSTFYFSFEADVSPQPPDVARKPDNLALQVFRSKRGAVFGLPDQTKKFLTSNLSWLGFEILHWDAGTSVDALLAIDVLPLDLVIFASNALSASFGVVLVKVLTRHRDARFIIIGARREVSTQLLNLSDFKHSLELLSTPLKVRSLLDALMRLFKPAGLAFASSSTQLTKKKRVSFPRLVETCPMNILCVDDNAVNIKVLTQVLGRLGYSNCDVAQDGEAAVSKCRQNAYDLVLMDLQMPRMDGTTAMGIIREEQPGPIGPTIVALTASAMSGDREEALGHGFHDYIAKPIIVTSLIECLRRVFSKRTRDLALGLKRPSEDRPQIKRRHTSATNNDPLA